MYDKWHLTRNPFYTRPIDFSSLDDYVFRKTFGIKPEFIDRSREGLMIFTGERGVGTTSLANYIRFSSKGFTPKLEIRLEGISDPVDLLEMLIFSTAKEILDMKMHSKTAKSIIDNYQYPKEKVNFSIQAAGFGVGWGKHKSSGQLENLTSLSSVLEELISDILQTKKYDYCIYQMNNFDVPQYFSEDAMQNILDPMRDIFHAKNVVWFLLGNSGLERLVKGKLSRVSSIVKHWIKCSPISPIEFRQIYNLRIRNSGKSAISPFTDDAVKQLSECSMGRTRFALDIASRLMEKYADQPLPEVIEEHIISEEAKGMINQIAETGNFSEKTKILLKMITKSPGINASELSKKSDISPGNLIVFMKPLMLNGLVEKIQEGRMVRHYPMGLGVLVGNNIENI